MKIINAVKNNARELASLINIAGDGIPETLWNDLIEADESWLDVGTRRAAREDGDFSYTNARVCVEKEQLLGMVIAYQLPDPYPLGELSEQPALVRPLIELESLAAGSWYINAIATYKTHRGKGVARQLLEDSERQAKLKSCSMMSLIVAADNNHAKRLYEYIGFMVKDSLPMAEHPGSAEVGEWLLMTRVINDS